jgi:uncharacterized membrane protein (DUF106 family)
MPTDEDPLPSGNAPLPDGDEETEAEAPATDVPDTDAAPAPEAARPRPPAPQFKIATFIYVFLGMLGLLMIIDTSARNAIAGALGAGPGGPAHGYPANGPLYFLIGFDSHYLLLTMALAGALEMLVTAFAYNYTTDWIKAAKVQKWSSAFRKVQMAAIRSGKKDRIAALKPFQQRITSLSSEVSIAQFKGLAITWFLLILIYTWVGIVIQAATTAQQTVSLGGSMVNLYTPPLLGYFPPWFIIFSLYTVPLSLVFRRILKNYWLRRYLDRRAAASAVAPGPAGGSA